jgi:C-terminal processing protease CtpA/Prc
MNDPYSDEFLGLYFRRYLWLTQASPASYRIRVRSLKDKTERSIDVPSINRTQFEKLVRASPPALQFRKLNGSTALLTFSACPSREEVEKLADPIFEEIKNSGMTKLIVDARENTGGSDAGWHALLDYLTQKPYTAYRGSYYRITNSLKQLLGKQRIVEGYDPNAWDCEDGTEFRDEPAMPQLRVPVPAKLAFRGNWVLLSGRKTFSSGMSFVAATKQYQLAPVIGQETGGRVIGFGQWVEVTLPASKISIAVSTKQFTGIVPVPIGRGVPPDISVMEKPAIPLQADNNPVILAALNQLEKMDRPIGNDR